LHGAGNGIIFLLSFRRKPESSDLKEDVMAKETKTITDRKPDFKGAGVEGKK